MTNEVRNRGSPRLRFSNEENGIRPLSGSPEKPNRSVNSAPPAQGRLKTRHRLKMNADDVRDSQLTSEPESGIIDESPETAAPVSAAGVDLAAEGVRTDPQAPGVRNTRRKPAVAAQAGPDPAVRPGTVIGSTAAESFESTSSASLPVRQAVKKKTVRLKHEESQVKKPTRLMHPVEKSIHTAGDQLHRQVSRANEDNNVAVDAALKGDRAAGTALQAGEHAYHARKIRQYRRSAKAERKAAPGAAHVAEPRPLRENPQFTSNPYSRWQQKRAIKKEYAAARSGRGRSAVAQARGRIQQAVDKTREAAASTADTVRKHPTGLILLALGLLLLFFFGGLQSCAPIAQSLFDSVAVGTYPAEEADVLAAERAYLAKERELKDEMEHYAQYHPGYDEYRINADEIWHDPYVLMAIISACRNGEEWDLDSAMPIIEKYFSLQYTVTETVTTELRFLPGVETGTRTVRDPVTGETRTETYRYDVFIPYEYTICTVTLENKDLSHLPVVSMGHEDMAMFAMYMSTHGNMDGLFHGAHAPALKDPMLYDIPQSVLDADPTFARLMEEAVRYIGYPYVWGGSDPETSFDCSGYVSYVFTNSGVYNTGRLGAKGLRSLCRDVPAGQARPGDIVFFEGTMGDDVEGITHCGIYVGNNMMIHCGSPIGFANLTDSYWQKHFHSYGRVPY